MTRHSRVAGLLATRGALMIRDGAIVTSAYSNSLGSSASAREVRFIAAASALETRFTANSPVSRAFLALCLRPSLKKATIGGRAADALKKLYGARLPTPFGPIVEITRSMCRS